MVRILGDSLSYRVQSRVHEQKPVLPAVALTVLKAIVERGIGVAVGALVGVAVGLIVAVGGMITVNGLAADQALVIAQTLLEQD
jgi:hypothetical protein